MITLLGGELLCSLGRESEIVTALSTGKVDCGFKNVPTIDGCPAYPYFSIDETPRSVHPSIADHYLQQTADALLRKLQLKPGELANAGVFLGSSSIDYSSAYAVEQDVVGDTITAHGRVGGGSCVHNLMQRFGLTGPSLTYHTACTSSANALMDAASMLENNSIDYALVLGLELFLPATLEGFVLMQLLSQEPVCPFDRNRDGMVLGEAVSAVLLSREDIAPSPWHYLGGAGNCEIYSITGTDPSGCGIAQIMQDALDDTGTRQEDITAIKAHGTGSEQMDLAEMRGMEQVFSAPPYFSFKPYIGHTLGGCGTAELALLMLSVDNGFIPAALNFHALDSRCLMPPLQDVLPVNHGRFMLNYFGFGGNNTSFILEKSAS